MLIYVKAILLPSWRVRV